MDITEEPRSKRADEEATTKPDVAYYYPAPYWAFEESDWVKSLLLFFDRVAILLPDYMYGRHWMADQTLVAPLEERELCTAPDFLDR